MLSECGRVARRTAALKQLMLNLATPKPLYMQGLTARGELLFRYVVFCNHISDGESPPKTHLTATLTTVSGPLFRRKFFLFFFFFLHASFLFQSVIRLLRLDATSSAM
jgi:hypothetical protein